MTFSLINFLNDLGCGQRGLFILLVAFELICFTSLHCPLNALNA